MSFWIFLNVSSSAQRYLYTHHGSVACRDISAHHGSMVCLETAEICKKTIFSKDLFTSGKELARLFDHTGFGISKIFIWMFFFAIFSYHQQNFEMIRYDLEKMRVNYSNMESACDFSPYILLEKQETLGNFLFECFLLLLANKWDSWWVLTICESFLYDFFPKSYFPKNIIFQKG